MGFFSPPSQYWYMNGGAKERVPCGMTVVRKAVRSARLQVRPDGTLRVVAPPTFDIGGFLQRNAAWIEKRREEFDRLAAEGCGQEDLLLLHGRFHRLVPGARFAIDGTGGAVACPSVPALKRNLSRMLKEEVLDRLEACPDLSSRRQGRISVKMQKTRWGSCSTLGNLNVNLRVIALPDPLREYVVVHEAAHLREQNHSKQFWRLVGDHYPGYRAAEAELRRYWVILERNRVWGTLRDTG
ncbi:M48 family metallopeptidase [Methanoculleus oceani]|nr:SprT family zinc-dependent metalloprotease [Methanoculleus sp. CWC-02]